MPPCCARKGVVLSPNPGGGSLYGTLILSFELAFFCLEKSLYIPKITRAEPKIGKRAELFSAQLSALKNVSTNLLLGRETIKRGSPLEKKRTEMCGLFASGIFVRPRLQKPWEPQNPFVCASGRVRSERKRG